jgi:hypothetical protein
MTKLISALLSFNAPATLRFGIAFEFLYRLSFRSQSLDIWHFISRSRWRGVRVGLDGGALLSRIRVLLG